MAKPPFYLPDSIEMHLIRNTFVFHAPRIHFPGSFKQRINAINFHGDVRQDK